MSIQTCSDFTRNLYIFQCDFRRKYSEDATLCGLIMKHIVVRIINAGVTALLHAEMVCRAVSACFNNIREIFSASNEQLVGNDYEFSKTAFKGSWISFKAIFNPNVLQEEQMVYCVSCSEQGMINGREPSIVQSELDLSNAERRNRLEENQETYGFDQEQQNLLHEALQNRIQPRRAEPLMPLPEVLPIRAAQLEQEQSMMAVEDDRLHVVQEDEPLPIIVIHPPEHFSSQDHELIVANQIQPFEISAAFQQEVIQPLRFEENFIGNVIQDGEFPFSVMERSSLPAPEQSPVIHFAPPDLDEGLGSNLFQEIDSFKIPVIHSGEQNPLQSLNNISADESGAHSHIVSLRLEEASLNVVDPESFEIPAINRSFSELIEDTIFSDDNAIKPLDFDAAFLTVAPQDEEIQFPVMASSSLPEQDQSPVMQNAILVPLDFDEEYEFNLFRERDSFEMPVIHSREQNPLQNRDDIQPYESGAHSQMVPIELEEASLNIVDPESFEIPAMNRSFSELIEDAISSNDNTIKPLDFDADFLTVAPQDAEIQFPVMASSSLPEQDQSPVMQNAILIPLDFEKMDQLNVFEEEDVIQIPVMAPISVDSLESSPFELNEGIRPVVFEDFFLGGVSQDEDFHLPAMKGSSLAEDMQTSFTQHMTLHDLDFSQDHQFSVVDPFALEAPKVRSSSPSQNSQGGTPELIDAPSPTASDLEMHTLLPVFGSSRPEICDMREHHFGSQGIDEVFENYSKQAEEVARNLEKELAENMLKQENALAASQPSTIQHKIDFISAKNIKFGRDWERSSGHLCGHSIGRCHFSNGKIGIEHIATLVPLNIGKKEKKAILVGVFEPVSGTTAARFLSANFAKVLQTHLQTYNEKELNEDHILLGIQLAFIQLNLSFLHKNKEQANQGAFITVIMELNDQIWVMNLGASRVIIRNADGNVFHASSHDEQGGFGFKGARRSIPRITRYDLKELGFDSQVVIGNRELFEAAGTSNLTNWVQKNKKLPALDLVGGIVYSAACQQQRIGKQTALSCVLIDFNIVHDWEVLD